VENKQITQNNLGYQYENGEKVRVIERIVEIKQPVVVELTSKKYKIWMVRGKNIELLGAFFAILGLIVSFSAKQAAFGLILMSLFIGGIVIGIGRFVGAMARYLAWWNNG